MEKGGQMEFRYGELFCGAGGLAFGAASARLENGESSISIRHGWATDKDADACRTYRRNISPEDPNSVIESPVERLDLESLPAIDVLSFGFPCNDFSIVGEHKGMDGDYGPLYSYGVRVLNSHEPKWFFAENVGGLGNANEGNAFRKILASLERAGPGYKLVPHLYKFEEYGVPQARHRIIVIGIRRDIPGTFRVPAPSTPDQSQWTSSREAIETPPIPKDAPNNERTKQSTTVVERLKHISPGKNAWSDEVPEHLRLNVKSARLSMIYRRLDPDRPSYTITASGGGGTHGYHWSEPRALTNRERARLQTFPDTFVFEGGKESVRKQIGMAVPPQGARTIIEAVLKTFAGVEYDSVAAKWGSNGDPVMKQLRLETET